MSQMSSRSRSVVRRALIAAGVCIGTLLLVAPASADRGGRWRSHRGPRVGVLVGLPAVVLVAGHPRPYYGGGYYDARERAYERGYDHGYDDGYDDRAREEWRRRRHHHHHHDCDHWDD
jgi:hypothetical protein